MKYQRSWDNPDLYKFYGNYDKYPLFYMDVKYLDRFLAFLRT